MAHMSYRTRLARKSLPNETEKPAKGLLWYVERVNAIRSAIMSVLFLFVLIFVGIVACQEYRRDTIVIDSFSIHPEIEKKGFTSQVIANRLADEINKLLIVANSRIKTRRFVPYFSQALPDLELPEARVSMKSITQYLRDMIGKTATHISGELILDGDQVQSRVRVSDDSALGEPNTQTDRGAVSDIDSLLEKQAGFILSQTNPYMWASVLYESGRLDESLEFLRKSIYFKQRDHDYHKQYDYYSLVLSGIITGDKGDIGGAIAKFQDAINKYPRRSSAYIAWGSVLESEKEYDAALSKYRIARTFGDSEAALAENNQGFVLMLQRRYDEAIQKFQDAISLDSELASSYANWGIALHEKGCDGCDAGALEKFQIATSIEPESVDSFVEWAKVLSDQNNYEGALSKIKQALSIKPTCGRCYAYMAYVRQLMKDYESAVIMYRKASELNGSDASVYNNWGIALEKLGKVNEATTQYKKAVALNYVEAYCNLGELFVGRKDFKAAIELYKKASDQHANSPRLYSNWASALRGLRDTTGARERYSDAIKADPRYVDAYIGFGDTLMDQRDYSGAIIKYKEVLEFDSSNVLAYARLAVALSNRDEWAAAIANFQKVLDLNSDPQLSRDAKRNIELLREKRLSQNKKLKSDWFETKLFTQRTAAVPKKPQ